MGLNENSIDLRKANHQQLDEAVQRAENDPTFPAATLKLMKRVKLRWKTAHYRLKQLERAPTDLPRELVAEKGHCAAAHYDGPKVGTAPVCKTQVSYFQQAEVIEMPKPCSYTGAAASGGMSYDDNVGESTAVNG